MEGLVVIAERPPLSREPRPLSPFPSIDLPTHGRPTPHRLITSTASVVITSGVSSILCFFHLPVSPHTPLTHSLPSLVAIAASAAQVGTQQWATVARLCD